MFKYYALYALAYRMPNIYTMVYIQENPLKATMLNVNSNYVV